MPIKTFKGLLPIGVQERIHLSTNDGLTGYRLNKFQLMPSQPGINHQELIGQIFLTDQTNNITAEIDFSNPDIIAACYFVENPGTNVTPNVETVFDNETFNQDIFINITDANGGTVAANFYIELEQMKLDLNASTYITVKNIRSRTQV